MFPVHIRRCAPFAIALAAATLAATFAEAQYARKNPVVEAVAKTKNSIVTVRIPKQGYAVRDTVGTGVIVDERGIIVTNRHVVGASRSVVVRLADGRELTGKVLFADAGTDLAILRVVSEQALPALTLAPTVDLMVGEAVIAVGHPFGYTNTVSTGIVSALGREITMPTGDVLEGLIQTDASINPGNSGGPLLNVNGELIGINVALREGAQGIAFAINAGTVKKVLATRLSALQVAGVAHGLDFSEKVLAEKGDRQRVVVASVFTLTPAAKSGLREGDEILAVADRPVANSFDVERSLWLAQPGQKVQLKVVRSGQELTVELELGDEAAAAHMLRTPTPTASLPAAPANGGYPISFRD